MFKYYPKESVSRYSGLHGHNFSYRLLKFILDRALLRWNLKYESLIVLCYASERDLNWFVMFF